MNLVLLAIPSTLAVIVVVLLSYGNGIVSDEGIILDRLCSDTAHVALTSAGNAVDYPLAVSKELTASNNKFAMDFYRQVSGDENVLFSPANIYLVFSALYEGAGHDAARELQDAFGFEPDLESRYLNTAYLVAPLKQEYYHHVDISMANRFWMPENASPVSDAYAYTTRALYMAEIGSVPAGESGSAAVNDWVAKQTSGRATGSLKPLDPDASLVVASTATFDAPWAVQFQPENTGPADFDTGNGTVTIDMVRTTATFMYADAGTEQVLRVPYNGSFHKVFCEWLYVKNGTPEYNCDLAEGEMMLNDRWPPNGYSSNPDLSVACGITENANQSSTVSWIHPDMVESAFAQYLGNPPTVDDNWFSMLVVLPREPGGMRSLEARLSAELFEEWHDHLRHAKVDVTLPKFKSGGQYDLVPILEGLGVKKIGDAGSLPGISKDLYVSDAVHHAHVQVDAKQSTRPITSQDPEVAEPAQQQQHPYSFVADRPFLYFIQENHSGAILFMGKVTDPTA